MKQRVIFFSHEAGFERAFHVASNAAAAQAMGHEVIVVLSGPSLRTWISGRWAAPSSADDVQAAGHAEEQGIAHPFDLLKQAQKLGAVCWACESAAALQGLREEHLQKVGIRQVSLAEIWKVADGAMAI